MDIAKIRKKIKEESETRGGEKEGKGEVTPNREEEKETQGKTDTGKEASNAIILPQENEDKDEGATKEDDRKTIGVIRESSVKEEKSERPAEISVEKVKTEAVKSSEETAEDSIVELLTFNLSTEEFAFRVSDIAEILRSQVITTVPRVPDYVMGITSLRGKIIPVTDLKKRLSIAPPVTKGDVSSETEEMRKKILILKGAKGLFGVMIDKVKGVIRILPSDIAEPPAHLTVVESVFIEGVVLYNNRFISVIRMSEVLDINLK